MSTTVLTMATSFCWCVPHFCAILLRRVIPLKSAHPEPLIQVYDTFFKVMLSQTFISPSHPSPKPHSVFGSHPLVFAGPSLPTMRRRLGVLDAVLSAPRDDGLWRRGRLMAPTDPAAREAAPVCQPALGPVRLVSATRSVPVTCTSSPMSKKAGGAEQCRRRPRELPAARGRRHGRAEVRLPDDRELGRGPAEGGREDRRERGRRGAFLLSFFLLASNGIHVQSNFR